MKENSRILAELDNLLKEHSFQDILDGLCFKATVKANECSALDCHRDALRLHKLAGKIHAACDEAFGSDVIPG